MLGELPFRAVVALDFEFIAEPGERPVPVCMVAHELRSGQCWRLWHDQFGPAPPFPTGPDVLVVAYYASAEFGCYHVLGWPMLLTCLPNFVTSLTDWRPLAVRVYLALSPILASTASAPLKKT